MSRPRRAGRYTALTAMIALATAMPTLLGGCGDPEPVPPPPPVQDTVFGDTVGTMDRAREVQGVVDQNRLATERAVEAAEGAAP